MKNTVVTICAFLIFNLITSCSDEDSDVRETRPARETHFDFETGVKLGEKSLTYNNLGNLILEYYRDEKSSLEDQEIKYEYDTDGNQIKKMHRNPNVSDEYWIDVVTFENGVKRSESSLYEGKPIGYQMLYFYSAKVVDSTQLYYYNRINEEYLYMRTTFYEYDALGRLVRTFEKTGKGTTQYRYDGNKLMETCNLVPGLAEESYDCIKNEYNIAGKLIKITSTSPWRNEVQEELFYNGNVLEEKRLYAYPAYEPGNTIDIRLIKYEY